MDKLNILVTGGGSPGIAGTIYSLKKHRVIAVDMRDNVPGQYLADEFYKVPRATDDGFVERIYEICDRESIDVILPQNTAELDVWAEVDSPFPVVLAGRNIGKDEICEGRMVSNFDELTDFAIDYDKFVLKPPKGNGSRGVRIVTNETPDFYRKPGIPIVRWEHLHRELGETFEFFAMPFYEGKEITVDCFKGREFTAIPRVRDEIRSGISFAGHLVQDFDIIDQCEQFTKDFGLQYAFGFQFIDGKVIECNPRVQGTMVASTIAGANIIEAACFEALDLLYPRFDIDWYTTFTRYWGLLGENTMGSFRI
jgi:carbamoyl-phosphate synthase large subunit